MRAHVFQHVPFESIGSMEPWLLQRGFHITQTRFFEDPAMPAPGDIDLLIIMGGPMSINDEAAYPWLKDEKWAIRQYMKRGIPIVGICLGAQLIAAACGARVYAGQEKEIGWFPIQSTHDPENKGAFVFPDRLNAFHWHGDTFDLPSGATRIASSAGCANQAFMLGSNIIGLQFHLETTPDSAAALVENCRDEITPRPYVQDETEILAAAPVVYESINRQMERVLEFVTQQGPKR